MGNVLIVEDELLVALDLEHILLGSGFDVLGIVADSRGAECVEKGPEVALVDLNLRDGATGNAVARTLAKQFGTRIIFVTANPAQISNPPETAIGYVQKPFKAETVLKAVALALETAVTGGQRRLRAFS